jgi:hypothetical protein
VLILSSLAPTFSHALLAAVLLLLSLAAEEAVLATQGVQRCMELFLAYPFNNVLHRHVASLVTSLEGGSTRLATFLVQDCGLLQWLVTAPTEVRTAASWRTGPAGCLAGWLAGWLDGWLGAWLAGWVLGCDVAGVLFGWLGAGFRSAAVPQGRVSPETMRHIPMKLDNCTRGLVEPLPAPHLVSG